MTAVQLKTSFREKINQSGLKLTRQPVQILQVNVGKLCNQACLHCHVEAGPKRTEIMNRATVDRILSLLQAADTIHTVDITGGAPELNPHFRYFVTAIRSMGKEVIDRCNLTVFFEPGQEDTPRFLRDQKVQIVASLPCYTRENVDKQRGHGVFDKSIRALKLLNDLGFGKTQSDLRLNLVYNPLGAFLPGPQQELEFDYKTELKQIFNIDFNHLYTITNMPIKRFLHDLERSGKLQEYAELLMNSFNPAAALGVMCRSLISVGWDGQLYDCDFNQMLDIGLAWKKKTIWDLTALSDASNEPIAFADHCYGCTAGSGSSCGGSLL